MENEKLTAYRKQSSGLNSQCFDHLVTYDNHPLKFSVCTAQVWGAVCVKLERKNLHTKFTKY